MLMLMVVVVALTTMTPTLHAAGLRVRADKDDADDEALDLSHINPIDLCLFICQSCYDQVRLLQCANEFCLTKMSSADRLQSAAHWTKTCPGLAAFRRRR